MALRQQPREIRAFPAKRNQRAARSLRNLWKKLFKKRVHTRLVKTDSILAPAFQPEVVVHGLAAIRPVEEFVYRANSVGLDHACSSPGNSLVSDCRACIFLPR